ncbi:MAG TPA: Holliday junction resolvase RuvX, partial [Candidatus Megaira endosymbiont of Hartmannula sinica]|nr:Holliday junction resolvase RuvX [Candidatus Megaera endosymbiont of Hartmannula sinica]
GIFNHNQDINHHINNILGEVKKHNIAAIVIGMPVKLDNSFSDLSKRVVDISRIIEKKLDIAVILQDERFSTKEAENRMVSLNHLNNSKISPRRSNNSKNRLSRNKKDEILAAYNDDALAASIILEDFLCKLSNISDN